MRNFVRTILATFCLIILGAGTLHADPFTISLNTGGSIDAVITTQILGGYEFFYTNITSDIVVGLPPVTTVSASTFTATYLLVDGVGVLNVADVCATVDLFALAPCQEFAFSFTNLAIGNASIVSAVAGTDIVAVGDVAQFHLAGGSIALGGGEVDFTPPPPAPPPPPPSPVPEPSSVALVATGLIGAGSFVRRKIAR